MKRAARDDGYAGGQMKRPVPYPPPRADQPAQPQQPSGQKLTTNDALAYLKEVKEMFHDKREKYEDFLEVMKEFKAQKIDTGHVIFRVKELFKGHRKLILGFNAFLPKGYEITLPLEDDPQPQQKKPVEFDEAIKFVNKIKTTFQHDDNVYKSFLDILNMYRKEHKSIDDVYREVATLFRDHQDLLGEFMHFLPENSAATNNTIVRNSAAGGFGRRDERSSAVPSRDKNASYADRSSVDRPEREQDKSLIRDKDYKKRIDKERRDRDHDDKDVELDSHHVSEKHQSVHPKKAVNLLDDSAAELSHQGRDVPEKLGGHDVHSSSDDMNVLKSMCSKEFVFLEKVKERLDNPDTYQDYLKCLHLYSQQIITKSVLQDFISDILGKYPDLLEGFPQFLTQCEKADGFLSGVYNKNYAHFAQREMVDDRDKEKERHRFERERDRDHHDHDRDNSKERENRMKYMNKPISELDLSACERCTPSYRRLPKDYPNPTVSYKTRLGASVLNDQWVSVTSGSEDYSFKHMRKNQYEESLFRCEDDRFELDMLIESVNATLKRVEDVMKHLQDNTSEQEISAYVEDSLSALNMRCIERLYGDHGMDVMDVIRRNATTAFPVILCRLRQKQEEWIKCRDDFNKVWSEIYSKNYHKSLDHRSFYFKQQDTKNLSTKALLTEIKEISEKKRKDDNEVLAIAAGNRCSIAPDLQFEYNDHGLHEDLYQVIKYSCREIFSSSDLFEKTMRIWTTYLEPLFGVPPRPNNPEDTGDAVKAKESLSRFNGVADDSDESPTTADCSDNPKQINISCNGGDSSLNEEARAGGDQNKAIGMAVDEVSAPLQTASRVRCESSASLAVRSEHHFGRSPMEASIGDTSASLRLGHARAETIAEHRENDSFRLAEGHGDKNKSGITANGEVGMESSKSSKGLADAKAVNGSSKVEREEGELSPTGDFEEDNFGGHGDSLPTSCAAASKGGKHEFHVHATVVGTAGVDEADGENDADVDADDEGEESAHRSIEDSDNASEPGDDVSGCESADGDDCFREEEDGDHDENDDKAESEGEAEVMADAHDGDGDGGSLECAFYTAKPLSKYVPMGHIDGEGKAARIFYGNDSFYVLFRLHQILYERMLTAKQNLFSAEKKSKSLKDLTSSTLYKRFMTALYSLLDGTSDNTKFEDECRAIIGTQSYVLFTLDKLIYKLLKQLQLVASDEVDNKLLQLHGYEKSKRIGRFADSVYYENACALLIDENSYRFECLSSPTRLLIQLMGHGNEKLEIAPVSLDPHFSEYLQNEYLSVVSERKESKIHQIFLKRNKRKHTSNDESTVSKAVNEILVVNGLECKISCSTSKVSYVLDTEDLLVCRSKRRRKVNSSGSATELVNSSRVNRFYELHHLGVNV